MGSLSPHSYRVNTRNTIRGQGHECQTWRAFFFFSPVLQGVLSCRNNLAFSTPRDSVSGWSALAFCLPAHAAYVFLWLNPQPSASYSSLSTTENADHYLLPDVMVSAAAHLLYILLFFLSWVSFLCSLQFQYWPLNTGDPQSSERAPLSFSPLSRWYHPFP